MFGMDVPVEFVEPLIEQLCKMLEGGSYSITREEFLDIGLGQVKRDYID